MKLSVTKKELLSLCSRALGGMVTEIVITKPKMGVYTLVYNKMKNGPDGIDMDHLTVDQKIPAIKKMRTVLSTHTNLIGLWEAKWIVENWQKWASFVKHNNRVPAIMNSGGSIIYLV